ncbi:MAG: HipA domain-containing protein, partial [Holdemanella sp.]|nr:HipA domain-containing protein [Holdemanella sp.]
MECFLWETAEEMNLNLAKRIRNVRKRRSINLDLLYKLGGSSGGAHPKILTEINNEDWIIKFPAHVDNNDIGYMEYKYSLCAKKCGIIMNDTQFLSSKLCKGYFGTRRFDRVNSNKIHMITVSGLLEINPNEPNLDYNTLMKLTKILARNNPKDLENMFRILCFYVFAHNRNDY